MRIDLSKLASAAITIGAPIVAAAVLHKAATGRLDIRGAALDALAAALARRQGV